MTRSLRFLLMALVLAAAVFLLGAGEARGQGTPDAASSQAVLMPVGSPPVSMFLVPNGTGTQLAGCYAFGGVITNVYILVTLNDVTGLPVPMVPATDVRIEELQSPLAWCANSWYPPPAHAPNLADGPSNAAGQTRFSLAYHGGGWVQGPTLIWVLEVTGAWMPIPTPVTVSYNSPDINGDLAVNLTDVGLFAMDFFSAVYNYRSDFNFDGAINLTDLSMLAPNIGVTCP
ncbi:MAG: hypothetical protein ABFS42_14940 [Candidatus Krumholzibacteriota bacterium]